MPIDPLQRLYDARMSAVHRQFPFQVRYTVTVSPHRLDAGIDVLNYSLLDLLHLYKGFVYCAYVFEQSGKGKLHIHGVIVMKNICKFAKLRKHPTVQFFFKPYDDGTVWIEYMGKETPKFLHHLYNKHIIYSDKRIVYRSKLDWYGFI